MKKLIFLPLLAAGIAVFGTSCYSEYGSVHAKRGTVVGGLLGAGTGALIGENSGRELEGAAIGGAVGALAGGLLGSARDEAYYGHQRPYSKAPAPTTHRSEPVYNNYPPVHRTHHTSLHLGFLGGYHGGYRGGYRHHHHHRYHGHHRGYSRGRYCR